MLADLVGNFCSFSESKRRVCTSLAAIKYFVSQFIHSLAD